MTDGRIEFLTEKDIEYFQKLAEKGEAVVLTISEEDLLSLDFTKPVPGFEDTEINTQEELDQWVKKYKEEYRRLYGDNQETVEENQKIKKKVNATERDDGKQINSLQEAEKESTQLSSSLAKRLAKAELDPVKKKIVNQAVSAGANEKIINLLLQDDLTTDEMWNLYEIFIGDK